ncbi:MAG: 1,4-alpha-glucan branching protein GlgB [Oscillospiraceae bacterium]|nr:1,4-alpha-glucan branching protein GlgB [Oscillospiraceae bacterium]
MNPRMELPLYLFHQGTNARAYRFFGAHRSYDLSAAVFRAWAPAARAVSVVGDFNDWNPSANPCTRVNDQGVWEAEIAELQPFTAYKFCITGQDGKRRLKNDPFAFHCEADTGNSSKYYPLSHCYQWNDAEWLAARAQQNPQQQPMSIYEVHLGSWRRFADGAPFSYRKLADELIPYVKQLGFTHIEVMPLTEHPFGGSWGYQTTGYFAATSRYGEPRDLMFFIDQCHQAGLGVILDWVPAHFARDAHGLAQFDGEACFEYADDRIGHHKSWDTAVFDYSKPEVRSFLLSSAMFWLEQYHVDGLRVDAVASMLYRNYDREDGQWLANEHGGAENLEVVSLLQQINSTVLERFPGAIMAAEESTAWPQVTRPPDVGGLGFNFKWNMGWMNDNLRYFALDPVHRKNNHNLVTFSFHYAFSENFILPISHDEVVHGKHSLLSKMPGDYNDKFTALRAFLGFMFAHPGKKLLFMGQEIGQFIEWNYQQELDWLLLEYASHKQLQTFVGQLNAFYRQQPALWQADDDHRGFAWICGDDCDNSVIAFRRIDRQGNELVCVCNFTPVARENYSIGVPEAGQWRVLFHTDDECFGGSGAYMGTSVHTQDNAMHGLPCALSLNLAGNSFVFLGRNM